MAGVALHFYDDGSGRAVLIMHGLFGSSTNFRGIARRLAERCRVISVDLRNHGRSPWDDDVSYEAMSGDVVTLMDRLALDDAVLVGHSMGGKVAMTLALTHPGRAAALAVVDIAPVAYDHSHDGLIDAMLDVDLGNIGKRQDLDDQLAGTIADAGVRQFLGQNLVLDAGRYRWRVNLEALAAGMDSLTGFPDPGDGRYDGPCTFIYGEASNYVRSAHHSRIGELFPRARLVGVPGAGHWVHAEHPGRVVEVVEELVDSAR